ncbi:MAG: hypothetical protein HRT71_09190 [Flavobacteriales bacterium]|nr:hypothetical protein [Flavobacteriales bacterium]
MAKSFRYYITQIRKRIRNHFYFNQWALFYTFQPTDRIAPDLSQFKELCPPKDRFWADPHVIEKDDKYFVFMEEFLYEKRKGIFQCLSSMMKGQNIQ